MGNQSPHRCFTVSMSSWQRRRRLTSLSALDGTASVIHTCGGGASGGPCIPTPLGTSSSGNVQGWQDGKAHTGPTGGGLLPSGAFPHQASQTPHPGEKAWEDGDTQRPPPCSPGMLLSPVEGSWPLVSVLSPLSRTELHTAPTPAPLPLTRCSSTGRAHGPASLPGSVASYGPELKRPQAWARGPQRPAGFRVALTGWAVSPPPSRR